jgi:hypothetical protein
LGHNDTSPRLAYDDPEMRAVVRSRADADQRDGGE